MVALQPAIVELTKHFDFNAVDFIQYDKPGFLIRDNTIFYNSINDGLRALGNWISQAGACESTKFTDRGIMLDCSRGAVPLQDTLFAVIRLLALLGYNQLLLYTEDTYSCDTPLFGYLRGRFSKEEIVAIDQYCLLFNIELIPCIQLLGHLGNLLQYPQYDSVKDVDNVLLVGVPETYALINKMLDFWECVTSKRIHIGLDEAYGIGTGKYKQLFKEQPAQALFQSHLAQVIQMCHSRNKRPMLWSDMLFAASNLSDYYSSNSSTVHSVDPNVDYVYWDYFHSDPQHFNNRFLEHFKLGISNNLVAAPGCWTWNRFWTAIPFAFQTITACVAACNSSNVHKIILTLWGDDLNEYDLTSSFPVLIHLSDLLFNNESTISTANKFKHLCGGSLNDFLLGSQIDNPLQLPYKSNFHVPGNLSKFILWNDPVLATNTSQITTAELHNISNLSSLLGTAIQNHSEFPLNKRLLMPWLLTNIITIKVQLKDQLLAAYKSKNIDKIEQAIQVYLKPLMDLVERLWRTHRYLYLMQYKIFGWEVIELRYGGLMLRLKSLHERILSYVAYLKNGEEKDKFEWFNEDVFPMKMDNDLMPMEIVDPNKMDISVQNLKSTDNVNEYSTHVEMMLPLMKMEDLEADLVRIWDIGSNELMQDYKRSSSVMKNYV